MRGRERSEREADEAERAEIADLSEEVLPGLIDSHVHLDSDRGGEQELLAQLRDDPPLHAYEAQMNGMKVLKAGFTTVRNLDREAADRYRVEPYVVAADVYSMPPHAGRGGWTWYTGSAGWMYRLVIESLLGLRLRIDDEGAWLAIAPCVPEHWPSFAVDYRFRATTYRIEIVFAGAAGAAPEIELDGSPQTGAALGLVDDGQVHAVRVRAARSPAMDATAAS